MIAGIFAIALSLAATTGQASWYSLPGRLTASGEVMNPSKLTAAHKTLPFGSKVLVQNVKTGSRVVVTINDRGPFTDGRIIDLSKRAAKEIGILERGVGEVRIVPLGL